MTKLKMSHVDKMETYNSGGGNMIDLVYLKTGQVLSINEECIQIHESLEDHLNCDNDENVIYFDDLSTITDPKERAMQVLLDLGWSKESIVELIEGHPSNIKGPCCN